MAADTPADPDPPAHSNAAPGADAFPGADASPGAGRLPAADASLPQPTTSPQPTPSPQRVALVGCGVVGRAILNQWLGSGCEILLIDRQATALQRACDQVRPSNAATTATNDGEPPDGNSVTNPPVTVQPVTVQPVTSPLPQSHAAWLLPRPLPAAGPPSPATVQLMIESISENLDHKQRLFQAARQAFGGDCVLASNTSNLSIASIFAPLGDDPLTLGMHFFMPVSQRPLVELIAGPATAADTIHRCEAWIGQLGKQPLVVADTPGFVVNRLLAPYLNQALLLLGLGASDAAIDAAATTFGMPLSPLELIDRIGLRTAFDSGRVFWRHFAHRIDPAPILPGMIKAGRGGGDFGGGFYDYDSHGNRSAQLNPTAAAVIQRYHRDSIRWQPQALLALLTIPMWIEATELLSSGLVPSAETIQRAVQGGLGYDHRAGFWQFFDQLGSDAILAAHAQSLGQPAVRLPAELAQRLRRGLLPSIAAPPPKWGG